MKTSTERPHTGLQFSFLGLLERAGAFSMCLCVGLHKRIPVFQKAGNVPSMQENLSLRLFIRMATLSDSVAPIDDFL